MDYQKLTPEIGAIINNINLNDDLNKSAYNKIYEILNNNISILDYLSKNKTFLQDF